MMNEITYTPTPQNSKAKAVFGISLAISFIAFFVYAIMERYRGFVGLFGLFLLVFAIFMYTKFLSPVFYYDITFESTDEPLFIVRQKTGKRETTLSRICLSSISSVVREDSAEYRAHKTPTGYAKYIYAPTLFPPSVYRVTVSSRFEKAEIVIECTADFAEYMLRGAAFARENFTEEE